MTKPPLMADGGTLTAVRATSNCVYGSWRVTAPEGIEQIVPSETENPGYLYFPDGAPKGPFDLAFTRMDATIELDTISPNGVTSGRSDVETQMEAGQKRAEGRVLVQTDIPTRGLGNLVPGVDFTTGDPWPIKRWGKIITLPLTALDWESTTTEPLAVAVRAGGQLLQDPETLRSLNGEAQQQLDAEARQRAREIEEQRQRSNQINRGLTGTDHGDILAAAKGSEGALGTLNQVDIRTNGEVENVRRGVLGQAQNRQYTTLGGMNQIADVLRSNFLNRYYTDENGRSRNMLTSSELSAAEAGLIPAYVTMNNIMWEQQMLINAVHGDAIEALSQATTRLLWADREKISQDRYAYVKNPVGVTNVTIQAKSGWTGQIVVLIATQDDITGAEGARARAYNVTSSGGSWTEPIPLGVSVRNTTLFYRVKTSTDAWYR